MQVRHGWSGEVGTNRWAKFDITLEEEDLRRLLGSDHLREQIPTTVAYQLMELEAERLVLAKLVQRYGFDQAEGGEQIKTLKRQIDGIVAGLRRGVEPA